MLYKTINLKVDESGSISGYFSTYDEEPDSYGDIVAPGAFTETIAKRKETGHPFPLCFNHNFDAVIGTVDTIEDTEKGPLITAGFLNTEKAQEVREMVKSGAVWQFSFAYDIVEAKAPTDEQKLKGIEQVLTKLDLYEVSIVVIPANQNAVMTDVKSGRRNRKSDEDAIKEIIRLANSLLSDENDETPEETEEPKEEQKANEEADSKELDDLNARKDALLDFINKNMKKEDSKMNLKEKLAAKETELKALAPQIEEGDEECIKSSEALAEEIKGIRELIEKAEKANEIISTIGKDDEEMEAKEMNEMEKAHLEELKDQKGSRSFAYKAYNDVQTAPTVGVVDTRVVDPQTPLDVRDIFGSESINGNSLTYYTLSAMEGNFGATAQGNAKPQIHIPHTSTTVALQKIAGYLKETDELLSDAAFLESAIRGRGVYEFKKAVEAYLVGALTTAGIQAGQSTITFDNILKAKQAVRTATGYAADAILINPADLEALLLTKDSNLQYLLGGPAYGSYGNGAYNANPRIWGLTVVESAEIPEGACVVGAFKAGASVVTKSGEGLRVEVSNSDQDDFIKNRVTVRIEERLVLATRVPSAFVLVGTVSSSS